MKQLNLPYARVLVVDDMTASLDIMRAMMKPYNMQIDAAESGQQAVDAVRDEVIIYDAIFMDHMMPGMSGVEATEKIREIGTYYARNVPIIALTANALAENELMFLDKGFQAVICKTIERGSLDEIIDRWLRDDNKEKRYFQRQKEAEARLLANLNADKARTGLNRRSGIDRRALRLCVNGLDTMKAIAKFDGDEGLYYDILRSYTVNTPPLLDSIENVTSETVIDYERVVHGLKGSSRGICADEFAGIAERLEKAAGDGDLEFIAQYNPLFLTAARELLFGIEDVLAKRTLDNPRRKTERPDRELLDKLLAACEAYDMNKVDAILNVLDTYEYEHDGELVIWLRDNAEKLNLDAIVERLSTV